MENDSISNVGDQIHCRNIEEEEVCTKMCKMRMKPKGGRPRRVQNFSFFDINLSKGQRKKKFGCATEGNRNNVVRKNP